MPTPKEIKRFQENRDVYCSGEYNEAQAGVHQPWGHKKSLIQRQINRLVYELYSLTDKEIRIFEEAAK